MLQCVKVRWTRTTTQRNAPAQAQVQSQVARSRQAGKRLLPFLLQTESGEIVVAARRAAPLEGAGAMASGHGIAGMALLSAYGDEEDEDEDLEDEDVQKRGDQGGAHAGAEASAKGLLPPEAAEHDAARQGPSGASGREAGGESVDLGGEASESARDSSAKGGTRGEEEGDDVALGSKAEGSGIPGGEREAQPVSLFSASTGALGILDYGQDAADEDEDELELGGAGAVSQDDERHGAAAKGKAHVLTPPGRGGGTLGATPPSQASPGDGRRVPTPPSGEARAEGGRGASAGANGVHAAEERTGGAREKGSKEGGTGPSHKAGEEDDAVLDFLGPPVTEPCPQDLQVECQRPYRKNPAGGSGLFPNPRQGAAH